MQHSTAPTISLAMCTCNGERFLERQLASIAAQKTLPFELIVGDDCSEDKTPQILATFADSVGFPVEVYRNLSRLGVKENFAATLGRCRGDYIALVDQDDIWMEQRLSVFTEAISTYRGDGPLLLYDDPSLIDGQGNSLGSRFAEKLGIKVPAEPWRLLVAGNFVPGCCLVFDRRLLEKTVPIPDAAIMHDWWILLIAALTARVQKVPGPVTQYRLHGANQIGVRSFRQSVDLGARQGFINLLRSNLLRTLQQARSAVSRLKQFGHPPPGDLVAYLESYSRTPALRPWIMARLGITRGSGIRTSRAMLSALLITKGQLRESGQIGAEYL